MKIFECKCGSTEVFIEQSGNNTGLYCADCGKWVKWLNKDELRLANRQIENQNAKVRADVIARDYNTILIYEDTIRSMLLNTSQENNLIDWVDLNGKLNAITHIKHLIYELREQK